MSRLRDQALGITRDATYRGRSRRNRMSRLASRYSASLARGEKPPSRPRVPQHKRHLARTWLATQRAVLAAFVLQVKADIWLGRSFAAASIASPFRCRGYGRGRLVGVMSREKISQSPHTSVDKYVIPTQLKEARDILEHEREAVVLPIVGVIGKFDGSLNI